jgi:hypothetical protein
METDTSESLVANRSTSHKVSSGDPIGWAGAIAAHIRSPDDLVSVIDSNIVRACEACSGVNLSSCAV